MVGFTEPSASPGPSKVSWQGATFDTHENAIRYGELDGSAMSWIGPLTASALSLDGVSVAAGGALVNVRSTRATAGVGPPSQVSV